MVERCLYGVDLNPLALELAKLALWISSASVGKPLTFLDHHLRTGNSLYGTPLTRLASLPTAKQIKEDPLFKLLRETVVTAVLKDLAEITSIDSDTITTVKQKGESFKQAEGKATRLRDIANVWLASLFGLTGSDGKPLSEREFARIRDDLHVDYAPESWEARVADDSTLIAARNIARDEGFFHWELEFADAVVDGRCFFDAVIANPPYVGVTPNRAVLALYRTAKCGDVYGWIVERGLKLTQNTSRVGVVIPLSVMFGKSFSSLREELLSLDLDARISSYDNIPDCIFNTSSFGGDGTGKSMQRVAIILVTIGSSPRRVMTSDLLKWWSQDRRVLFDNIKYADTTKLCSLSSFPRIGNGQLLLFWERFSEANSKMKHLASDIISESRKPASNAIFLTLPRAVNYFISATPGSMSRNKVLSLCFLNTKKMDLARVLINSNVFYWYWRAFGDGFLLSVDVVGNFPVPKNYDDGYLYLVLQREVGQSIAGTERLLGGRPG